MQRVPGWKGSTPPEDTWFADTRGFAIRDHVLMVSAPNAYVARNIHERYLLSCVYALRAAGASDDLELALFPNELRK